MAMKHTLFLSTAALCLIGSAAADAQVGLQLNVGEPVYAPPPVAYAPAPVVVAGPPAYVSPYPHYYDPRHRRGDFEYWDRRNHPEHYHR